MAPSLTRLGLAFGGILAALLLGFISEVTRPTLLLVGNVTIDMVEGKPALGGAVSYAAAVAAAMGVRACIVTANAEDADLSLFTGHDVHVVPADATLTFEHTYTFWGNKRRLRVTAQPNVTLTMAHVPWHCRRAKVMLLGPLMPQDMDPHSFTSYRAPWWDRLLLGGAGTPRQQAVGLMAQGLQRALDGSKVWQLKQPSQQLLDSLGPSTTVFLSDVETDVWGNGTLETLAEQTQAFLVTRGSEGADEHRPGGQRQRFPVFQVNGVVDTNGAGDSFATGWMLAAAAGHSHPTAVANWAGAMAVSQPQSCKPGCVADLARTARHSMPPSDPSSRGSMTGAAASLWMPLERFLGSKVSAAAEILGGSGVGPKKGAAATAV